MEFEQLTALIKQALDDLKAEDVSFLDVRGMTSITDLMVIASGRSDRHAKSIAANLVKEAKDAGVQPDGVEGADRGEWVLIDLGDAIVHVMQRETRDFYQIEKLWEVSAEES